MARLKRGIQKKERNGQYEKVGEGQSRINARKPVCGKRAET